MTPDQIRIAVAECLGWRMIQPWGDDGFIWFSPHAKDAFDYDQPPDYPNDLNACSEMRKYLTTISDKASFARTLYDISTKCVGVCSGSGAYWDGIFELIDESPLNQCIAFLHVKGKWQ